MKKALLSVLSGMLGFVITYIGLCCLVSGWRIKLEAEPLIYLMESIKSMAFVKCLISGMVSVVLAAIPFFRTR